MSKSYVENVSVKRVRSFPGQKGATVVASFDGTIIEDSSFVSAVSGSTGVDGFHSVAKSVLEGSGKSFIEFRGSHRQKKEFYKMFSGNHTYSSTGKGDSVLPHGSTTFITYGKMSPYKKKIVKLGFGGAMAGKNALSGGMDVGAGAGTLAVAAGATLSAAALSGITLGAGVGVVILVASAAAAQRHVKNLNNNQVFLRISTNANSGVKGNFFPYEEKIYKTEMVTGGPLDFAGIRAFLQSV